MLNFLHTVVDHEFLLQPRRSVQLFLMAACGVLTCCGGIVVYTNTQHMIEVHAWLAHSKNVLMSLQSDSQRLQRIDSATRLYLMTGNTKDLQTAEIALVELQRGVVELQSLVHDNASQERHSDELATLVQHLSGSAQTLRDTNNLPTKELWAIRNSILTLEDEERELLNLRSDEAELNTMHSLLFEGGFLGFSLLVIMALFGFYIFESKRHRTFECRLSSLNDNLETTNRVLEQREGYTSLLKLARDEFQMCVSSIEAYSCAARHLQELVPGSSGAIFILTEFGAMLETISTWNDTAPPHDHFGIETCCALRTGKFRWRRSGHSETNCSHFAGLPPENYMCIPLAALGETLGFVYLTCPTKELADLGYDRTLQILEMVELASMSIVGLNLRTKLEDESIRDALTGLFNRRFMESALEREMFRVSRRNLPLAVLMLDIDNFKTFNDRFGHKAGDAVLREVAECFGHNVRAEDIICRYGGEEFIIIIMPELSESLAQVRAESIRDAIETMRVRFRGELMTQVSVSVGIAMYPIPAGDVDNLLRLADDALYQAKHAGRNCIRIAKCEVGGVRRIDAGFRHIATI
jgi:diguanylate cyclase (GGDEF)-like protein